MQKISFKNNKKKGRARLPACNDSISGRHRYAKHCGQGFMMIEAAFSIFIVGTILITFMAVMGSVYRTEFAKRDLIIATNLAQEGIEIVRQRRDNNWKYGCAAFGEIAINPNCEPFSGQSSDHMGQRFPLSGDDYCVDYTQTMAWDCDNILEVDADGFYQHAGASATKFSRFISWTGANEESRTITSRVDWSGKSVTMTDTLYAWGNP